MWDFGKSNKGDNANSDLPPDTTKNDPAPSSVAGVLDNVKVGEEEANANGDGALTIGNDLPRKRGRPRGTTSKPAEPPTMALFSEKGIGKLWVNAWNGVYHLCGAEKLSPEEEKQQAEVFAHWCKSRFPNTPDKYQPDILLAASVLFMVAPRVGPIAKTTAPWWKRMFDKLRGKKSEEGPIDG